MKDGVIHGQMQSFALTVDKFIDHGAKWHPNVEIVTAGADGSTRRIGYAALRERSRKLSSVLAGLGIKRGDIIATLAWNSQAHLETWFGIMGIGAVCHTLNCRLSEAHLVAMLRRSGARLLLVSADLAPLAARIASQVASLERVLSIDADLSQAQVPGVEALEPLLVAAQADAVWGDFPETLPASLCFTSGTTGAPKGVTYTHRSTFLHTLRSLQADTMALSTRDTVLLAVPMFHANGWGVPFATPAVGARLVLPGRNLEGQRLATLIKAEAVTVAIGIGTVWLGVVEYLEASGQQLPSLRRVIVGGAPLAPALMARIEQRLGVTVQTSWGMTELSPTGTVAPPGDPARDAHHSGRPSLGIDLCVTDAQGEPLPRQRGVEGHLRVRGASTIRRYFGETRDAVDANGWFDTGDLARIDEAGNLIITGRAKDLIKSGGEWINPAEIEELVGRLPEVSLAAVIGREDPKWGERPVLLVEMREGTSLRDTDLLEALRGKVAAWWIPDAVVRLEHMPLAATGKIDKLRLKSEFGSTRTEPVT